MFYVWFYGHIYAYKLLGLDVALAEKVFAVNDNGTWEVYTQEDNLDRIKNVIKNFDNFKLSRIIEEYLNDFKLLLENSDLALDKKFIGC